MPRVDLAATSLSDTKVALRERVKELSCVYQVFRETESAERPLEEMFHAVAALLPVAWLHSEYAVARIRHAGREYLTPGFRETSWMQTVVFAPEQGGEVTVAYLVALPTHDDGARVKTQLTIKAAADFLKDQNAYLESEVKRRTEEVLSTQDAAMVAMASLAETRDNETGNHIRRTQHYVRLLAAALLDRHVYADVLTPESVEVLFKSAPLHDIGKVGIPDSILLKPGKLTPEEFEIMKTHTTIGRDTIAVAERLLPTPNSFMKCAREIAHSHQEKWDGSGYPQGLKGEAIPVPARLMAVADVYDALISRRVYKMAMPHATAVEIIREGRATHFDPRVVDVFLGMESAFWEIAQRFTGEDVARPPL